MDSESESWYNDLPKKIMLSIHRYNSERIFEEIQHLTNLRNEAKDLKIQLCATNSIIDAYIKYDRIIAEGPVLSRHKELTEELEKIVSKK